MKSEMNSEMNRVSKEMIDYRSTKLCLIKIKELLERSPTITCVLGGEDAIRALEVAIKAYDKSMPSPIRKNPDGLFTCPACKKAELPPPRWMIEKGVAPGYCMHCGQAFDWDKTYKNWKEYINNG